MVNIRSLYEKYCVQESDGKYYCEKDGRTYDIVPAKETELDTFKSNCEANNVPIEVIEVYYWQRK